MLYIFHIWLIPGEEAEVEEEFFFFFPGGQVYLFVRFLIG